MKKPTMILVLGLAMIFAYASAKAQQPTSGNSGANGQSGMQNANNQSTPMNNTDASTSPQPSSNTAKVSDSDLQEAVKSKLASDPAFANVQAAVDKGTVTLDGTVNASADKKKAKDEVKSVAGVRRVKEHLTVNGNEMKNQPKSSSAAGPTSQFLSSQDAAQGNASQNTAGSIAGNSQTSANPSSSAPQATAPEAGSMSQSGTQPSGTHNDVVSLQKAIEKSIKNDPSLTDSTVTVNVLGDSIELNGTVGSEKAKMNAERIAQSQAQNRKVTNNLQVTGAGNSDLNSGHSAINNGATTTPSSAGTPPQQQTQPQTPPR
ncbi:MAG TPA: BON domain-containing protein [Candidatus Koribacter sp.]|jgi:osmotically-inducible protein OsmY